MRQKQYSWFHHQRISEVKSRTCVSNTGLINVNQINASSTSTVSYKTFHQQNHIISCLWLEQKLPRKSEILSISVGDLSFYRHICHPNAKMQKYFWRILERISRLAQHVFRKHWLPHISSFSPKLFFINHLSVADKIWDGKISLFLKCWRGNHLPWTKGIHRLPYPPL